MTPTTSARAPALGRTAGGGERDGARAGYLPTITELKRRRIEVLRGDPLRLLGGDARDARLVALRIVEPEPELLHRPQEAGELAGGVEAQREAADQVRLRQLQLPRGHRLPAHARHLLPHQPHRFRHRVGPGLERDEVRGPVAARLRARVDRVGEALLLPHARVEPRGGAAAQHVGRHREREVVGVVLADGRPPEEHGGLAQVAGDLPAARGDRRGRRRGPGAAGRPARSSPPRRCSSARRISGSVTSPTTTMFAPSGR